MCGLGSLDGFPVVAGDLGYWHVSHCGSCRRTLGMLLKNPTVIVSQAITPPKTESFVSFHELGLGQGRGTWRRGDRP